MRVWVAVSSFTVLCCVPLSSDFVVSCFYLYHIANGHFEILVLMRMILLGIQVALHACTKTFSMAVVQPYII